MSFIIYLYLYHSLTLSVSLSTCFCFILYLYLRIPYLYLSHTLSLSLCKLLSGKLLLWKDFLSKSNFFIWLSKSPFKNLQINTPFLVTLSPYPSQPSDTIITKIKWFLTCVARPPGRAGRPAWRTCRRRCWWPASSVGSPGARCRSDRRRQGCSAEQSSRDEWFGQPSTRSSSKPNSKHFRLFIRGPDGFESWTK